MKLHLTIILFSIIILSISCDGQHKSEPEKAKFEVIESVKKPEKITKEMQIDNLKKIND